MAVVTDFTAVLFDNDAQRWNGARDLGTPVIVTYSFDDRAAELPSEGDFPDKVIGDFTTGFADAGQQAIVRDALAVFAASAGIRFVEVETGGMLQFVDATSILSNGNVVSFANTPSVNAAFGSLGHVVMNQAHFPLAEGNSGFRILLHEIGHGLGLDHSDQGTNTLDPSLEGVENTVMKSVGAGEIVSDIGTLDKQALAFLYGGISSFNLDQLTIAADEANAEIDIAGTSVADRFMAPVFDTNMALGGGGDVVFGNQEDDEIDGEDGDDTLFGGGGADILRGGAGADELDGLGFLQGNFNGGADQLFGGDGDDRLFFRFQTTVFDGGDGDDILDGTRNSSISLNFTDAAKFVSIETAILPDGDSFFQGAAANETVFGGNGDDTLIGADGDDVLDGGAGADQLAGQVGNDRYVIDDAGDTIFETSGEDTVVASIAFTLPSAIENGEAIGTGLLTGNSGANTLLGDIQANALSGAGGDDILVGRGGDDVLTGGAGFDRLNGGSGADTMSGGDGDDIYTVDDVGDVVNELADEGVDRINAFVDFANPDSVEFLVGLFASVGLELTGSAGRDRITGANRINSGDVIDGADGGDKIVALVGDDVIGGGAGADRIFGNSGDDVITGGLGNDRMTGQFGADSYIHAPGDHNDRITDFSVIEDVLDLSAHGFASFAAVMALTNDIAGGALIDLDGPDSVLLEGVAKAAIGAEDILI